MDQADQVSSKEAMLWTTSLAIAIPFAAGLLLCLAWRWLWVPRVDRANIRNSVESQGGTVLEIQWVMSGTRGARMYLVRYCDRDGSEVRKHCKTSALSGEWWSDPLPASEGPLNADGVPRLRNRKAMK
jgi:hypothetical protein